MPPLETYVFKHKTSSLISMTIKCYGEVDAWGILERIVNDKNEWTL